MNNQSLQLFARKCRLFFWLAILVLITANSGFAQTNLITNGDFENKTTGWMVWGASLANTTDKHSGSSAALVSNRKNPWDAIARDIKSLVANGESYTLSVWVKIPKPTVNFRATLHIKDGSTDTYHGYLWTNSPVIGSYAFYTETFTLNWTGNLAVADLYFETESVGGVYSDYLVDDVQLIKTKPLVDVIQEGPGLKDIKSSMLIGGCVNEGSKNYWTSAAGKAQVLKDCNTVTVQCYPGWGRWDETKHHVYHVDNFTNQVHEMKKQNMTVTAHMLLGWDQYFPAWYKENDFPADTLDAIMKSWLKGIIQYKGNDTLVDVWNVVNEAISWDGKGGYWPENNPNHNDACEMQRMGYEPDVSGLTGTKYVNAQHPVYIRKAFEYARTLTKKKLELRDSGFEFPDSGAKYNAFYQLAVHLKKMSAPVDVIGFQTHIDLEKNYDWEAYTNNIKRYVQLGYEVNIPEVDIGDAAKNWSDYKAELQKIQYYNLVTAAIRGGASEMQTWGFTDDGWRVGQHAFPYTNNFEAKPAYYGIKEALIDMSSMLFWEMDAPVNNIMPDVMKYNNFGTLRNFSTPSIVTGFKGKALQFDGVDDYISSGKLSATFSGDFSFSCFLKSGSSKATIIADLAHEGISGLKIGINSEGKIYLNAAEAGLPTDLSDTTKINDNTWHFIAIRRDSTSYQLYVDGSASKASGQGMVQKIDQLNIGAKCDGSSAFEGILDEVKLFDSAVDEGSFMRSIAPINPLKLTSITNGLRVRLSWLDKSTNEDGFIVERKTANSEWEEYYRLPANSVLFVEELKLYNTEYTYRICSFNKFAKSAPSNEVVYLTPNDPNTLIQVQKKDFLISVFPNPAHNQFTLVSSGNPALKIYDFQGSLMFEKKKCSASETIDLSGFSSGIYFLQANSNERKSVVKLVKN
jgi:GH35 family endo-1,4-beta-xylanase